MTRFFMTIPEAVQLVIQAGAIGGRGQVYVLDMGEPVRIVELAETMIRLSGKEPGTDVAIEFVGARPGEKLHEELWGDSETVTPSEHEAILLVTRPPIDADWLEGELDELAQARRRWRDARARRSPELHRRGSSPKRRPRGRRSGRRLHGARIRAGLTPEHRYEPGARKSSSWPLSRFGTAGASFPVPASRSH